MEEALLLELDEFNISLAQLAVRGLFRGSSETADQDSRIARLREAKTVQAGPRGMPPMLCPICTRYASACIVGDSFRQAAQNDSRAGSRLFCEAGVTFITDSRSALC